MLRKVLAAVILFSLFFTMGCEKLSTGTTVSTTGSTIVNDVDLAGEWNMNQMRLDIKANDELFLLLKLDPGDETDGYFYLENGKNVNFDVTGASLVYETVPQDVSGKTTSDRFNFTASEDEGTTYTLAFRNSASSQITVFLELIYPLKGSLFVPVTK